MFYYLGCDAGKEREIAMLSFIKYNSYSKGSIERAYRLWSRTDAGLIPLQYSCLGNPVDRGPWWATVHGLAEQLDITEH